MPNCKKKPNARQETYCSSCPSQPEFVEEKKTCHSLTSHVTPSFLHAKESRTEYDLYLLHYYNQHAKNMDYDLTPSIESFNKSCTEDSDCPGQQNCVDNSCVNPSCTEEPDCPSEYIDCVNNTCVECTTNSDCDGQDPNQQSSVCRNGMCVKAVM